MFRRSALSAAASLAVVVLLAVTGCKIQLRHQAREDLHRLGELLQHLPQPEPRARADHLQSPRYVRNRGHLCLGLPERQALVLDIRFWL